MFSVSWLQKVEAQNGRERWQRTDVVGHVGNIRESGLFPTCHGKSLQGFEWRSTRSDLQKDHSGIKMFTYPTLPPLPEIPQKV